MSVSNMIRKYKNFDISTQTKVHKIRLKEKLMLTLERNDVERPKVLAKKAQVYSDLKVQLETQPEVKEAVGIEMRKRETTEIHKYYQARKAYCELLNHIQDRFLIPI